MLNLTAKRLAELAGAVVPQFVLDAVQHGVANVANPNASFRISCMLYGRCGETPFPVCAPRSNIDREVSRREAD